MGHATYWQRQIPPVCNAQTQSHKNCKNHTTWKFVQGTCVDNIMTERKVKRGIPVVFLSCAKNMPQYIKIPEDRFSWEKWIPRRQLKTIREQKLSKRECQSLGWDSPLLPLAKDDVNDDLVKLEMISRVKIAEVVRHREEHSHKWDDKHLFFPQLRDFLIHIFMNMKHFWCLI